jgi:hypothetical protein
MPGDELKLKTHSIAAPKAAALPLAKFARRELPQYESDNGPLTAAKKKAIARARPRGPIKIKGSLS